MVYSCTLGRPFNVCLVSVVVSVMDSHKYDRGSSPGQGNHIHVRYALNSIQFISDKSSTELALYLWDLYFTYKFNDDTKCTPPQHNCSCITLLYNLHCHFVIVLIDRGLSLGHVMNVEQ